MNTRSQKRTPSLLRESRPSSLTMQLSIVASIAIVAALGFKLVGPSPTPAAILGLGIVLMGLIVVSCEASRDQLGPLALTFWAFMVVWAGFAPLYQLRVEVLPWQDTFELDLFPWAQALTLVAMISYLVGARMARSGKGSQRVLKQDSPSAGWAALVGLAAFPIALLSGVSIRSRFSTRDDLILAYADQGIAYSEGQGALLGILKTLPLCMSVVAVYVTSRYVRDRLVQGETVRLRDWVALLIGIASAAVFANPLTNSRFQALSAILAVLIGMISLRSTRQQLTMAVGMIFGLMSAYPLTAVFKGSFVRDHLVTGWDSFASVDFDGFQQTVNSLYFVQANGFTWGRHLVSALGFFVPRSIWSSKALPASYPVAEARGYEFLNLSLPIWAEAYVEFGVVGTILMMLLVGWLSAKGDFAYLNDRDSYLGQAVPLLAAFQIGIIRGPLGAQIVTPATTIMVFVLVMVLSRNDRRIWRRDVS